MFRKEIENSIKLSINILIVVAGVIFIAYFAANFIMAGDKIKFLDILEPIIWTGIIILPFYLGGMLFSKERAGNTFEYFFSLPVARHQLLLYKILPRFLMVLFFFILHLLLRTFLNTKESLLPISPVILLILLLGIFLLSVSHSLMFKSNYSIMMTSMGCFFSIFIITLVMCRVIYITNEQTILTGFVLFLTIFSLALFIGFFSRFRKVDFSNMLRLSRRNLFQVIIPVVGVLILYIGINLFDIGKPENLYTESNLLPADYNPANGFYRLWTLGESKDTDVNSPEVIDRYRRLFDPQFDNKLYWKNFNFREYHNEVYKAQHAIDIGPDFGGMIRPAVWNYLSSIEPEINEIKQKYSYLLDRYQALVETPLFSDLTPTSFDKYSIYYHMLLLRLSRLYLIVNALDAIHGQWEKGVTNIIANISLIRKITWSAREHLTNLIAKSMALSSLQLLVSLMNREDCPVEVYQLIMNEMPPLKHEDFGSKNSFIFESLVLTSMIEDNSAAEIFYDAHFPYIIGSGLFLQKNRTIGYAHDYVRKILDYEATLPYQWKTDLPIIVAKDQGAFWWVINPIGKILFKYMNINLAAVIFKSYRLKTIYDMTRIAAELHLKDDPTLPIPKILEQLETYKSTIDPCSGKPYQWNSQDKVLYSIGTDRVDQNGKHDATTFKTDFVVPIHLKNRN